MSLIVAIKDRDRFVFGSDRQASFGQNKSHDATKIWPVEGLPGAIMGSVGTVRGAQLIQYNNIIDLNAVAANGGPCTTYVVNSLVPSIYKCLKANGMTVTTEGGADGDSTYWLPNIYLFAYEDQAWCVWHDLTVIEIENYKAIGSGSDVADGVLFATSKQNPFERIATSIAAAAETTLFVDMGIDILATKAYPKDKKQIKAALGEDATELEETSVIIDKAVLEEAIKKELAKDQPEPAEEEKKPPKKKSTKTEKESK